MSARFNGLGCFKKLVDVWNDVFFAVEKIKIYQKETISGNVYMSIRNGIWEVEMGQ